MLEVNEMFKSIQGEGIDVGREAVFVRFSGCNLHCKWCDTAYARERGKDTTSWSSIDLMRRILGFQCEHVVLTGGEPMIQDPKDLSQLCTGLRQFGINIAVETNGTVPPLSDMMSSVGLWTLSPKMSSSGNKCLEPVCLKAWIKSVVESGNMMQFKFVVQNDSDMSELGALLFALPEARGYSIPVVLQPEASAPSYYRRMPEAFRTYITDSDEYDVRYIPQVHKLMGVR